MRRSDCVGVPPSGAQLITIVRPPISGGVSDYAMALAEATGCHVSAFDSGIGSSVRGDERRDVLFIQVSHYGYEKRGVPLKLLWWIAMGKRSGVKIGFYFHELFAFGPPWTSSFWLSPVQRFITGEMARLADFWITNREASAQWLLYQGGVKRHKVLPVFSNVGEAQRYQSSRTRALVVFGSSNQRAETYRSVGPALFEFADRQDLEIHDVGPRLNSEDLRQEMVRRGVMEHGRLPIGPLSALLSGAMFGLLAYPVAFIAKSGVFAAYCAHGICPLVVTKACAPADGLLEGTHYWHWSRSQQGCLNDDTSTGRRAFEWYSTHTVLSHSRALLTLAEA